MAGANGAHTLFLPVISYFFSFLPAKKHSFSKGGKPEPGQPLTGSNINQSSRLLNDVRCREIKFLLHLNGYNPPDVDLDQLKKQSWN